MKKLITGFAAILLLSGVAAYAGGGGKKKARKAARKQECCIKTPGCDKNKCNSVNIDERTKAENAEEVKSGDGCCKGQSTCNKGN